MFLSLPAIVYPVFYLAPLVSVGAGISAFFDIAKGARTSKWMAATAIVLGVLLPVAEYGVVAVTRFMLALLQAGRDEASGT